MLKNEEEFIAELRPQLFAKMIEPNGWLWQGRKLQEAADILIDNYRRAYEEARRAIDDAINRDRDDADTDPTDFPDFSVARFLYALAIENYIKGHLAGEDKIKVAGTRLTILDKSAGHELGALATSVQSFDYKKSDYDKFDDLTRTLVWAGRYPSPLTYNKQDANALSDYEVLARVTGQFGGLDNGDDLPDLQEFGDRLHESLEKICSRRRSITV